MDQDHAQALAVDQFGYPVIDSTLSWASCIRIMDVKTGVVDWFVEFENNEAAFSYVILSNYSF